MRTWIALRLVALSWWLDTLAHELDATTSANANKKREEYDKYASLYR